MSRDQVKDLDGLAGLTFNEIALGTRLQAAFNAINSLLAFNKSDSLVQTVPSSGVGSNDTAVATGAVFYKIAGVLYNKGAVAAGTALAAGTITANKWAVYIFTINAAGTIACAGGAGNVAGYASEAAALAALPAVPTSSIELCHVTVKTASAQTFVAGTDSLKSGSTGHVASETNYYDAVAVSIPSDAPIGLLTTL